MGDLILWAVRYLLVGIVTYLFAAYVDLIRGPRIEFGRNVIVAALWPVYWGWLLWIKLRRFRGDL